MALGLLDLCRDKLYSQMASPKVNLRILVGHSNLHDALVNELNKYPEYYSYDDTTGCANADAHAYAMCGWDDDSKAQDTDIITAYPVEGETTAREYAWWFPAKDAVSSQYRGNDESEEEEDEDVGWDSNSDDDDDDNLVFSNPPARVLTVRNPDPDPVFSIIEKPASWNKLSSYTLETIPEDATPSDPSPTSNIIRQLSTPNTSKQPASTTKSNLISKKPALPLVREVWWKGGDSPASPVYA
ncbi:uncharacterized protein BDW70DRAFT_143788 [Aspergillus foveolatus]|uniref:uncharacterized protein n=1 Tax=Aspergillus foveolatus TaxID=210207 RepID=UPI003CCCB3B6